MRLFRHIFLLLTAVMLATGCAEDDRQGTDDIPDGYGRLTITISTPEAAQTRAVDTTTPWLEGSDKEREIKSYILLICNGTNIMQVLSSTTGADLGSHDATNHYYPSTQTITSDVIPLGEYNFTFYCLANFTVDMLTATGLTVNNGQVTNTTLPVGFETKVMQPIVNGTSTVPSTGLPMTGKLTVSNYTLTKGMNLIADPLILWRMMAKLEFLFTNNSAEQIKIMGIEVDPINQATASSSGVYLISQDDLSSVNDLVPLFPSSATKTVSAIWPLNTATLQTTASVSMGGVFEATELSLDGGENSKLDVTKGLRTAGTASLYKFEAKEDIGSSRDNAAVITFKVTPKTGMTFTPKNLSFKACRGGTNGGNFDVVTIINGTNAGEVTGVRPERYSVYPYYSTYSYPINVSALTGETVIKIYVYGLTQGKDYAFGDVAISGDVTNNTGTDLQEHITLPTGALTDTGPVSYTPATDKQTINANGGTRTLFFYVNETDATFTNTENQLSLRFKIKRGSGEVEELRYGVTTPYIDGRTGGNGFNVIRRNDWIHIPVVLTDWQIRIEPLAFVPIAGYPATTVSSDGLTATFSTGGMIALQPFVKKRNDTTWRDFGDPQVTFVSLSWKNSNGTDVFGDDKIVKTAFAYDPVTKSIIGELNNDLDPGTYKTTFTVNVSLGPSTGTQYHYSFTFNVVLQK